MIDGTQYVELIIPYVIALLPQLVLTVATLIVGLWAVKLVVRILDQTLETKKVDPTLKPFLISFTGTLLKVLVIITVASMVGVEMTSFVALMGAAGLAVGLSLQGSLQNFAGGVLILSFKPFRVGDVIQAQGYTGKVKTIQIFNTILTTPDNKTIIIPNGELSNNSLTNYSTEPERRVDMTFGISYDDDVEEAKKIISKIVTKDKRILKDPEPFIRLAEMADSSLHIVSRLWVKAPDFWDVHFDTLETVKEAFDKEGISIPYPQMDVHVKNE